MNNGLPDLYIKRSAEGGVADIAHRSVSVKDCLAKIRLDENGALAQQIYIALRRMAIDLVLLPNQFISEKDVATELSVSKTPVREAFIRLAEDGVVKVMPKSGTYVTSIDFARAEEGFFIWGALESSCVASLAERHSLRDMGELRDLISNEAEAAQRRDYAGFRAVNNAFYEAIFELADFPVAKRLTTSARFEVDRVRNILQMYRLVPLEKIVADHGEIVNAVAAGDGAKAEAVMMEHISDLCAAMQEMVGSEDFRLLREFFDQKRTGKRRARNARESS